MSCGCSTVCGCDIQAGAGITSTPLPGGAGFLIASTLVQNVFIQAEDPGALSYPYVWIVPGAAPDDFEMTVVVP